MTSTSLSMSFPLDAMPNCSTFPCQTSLSLALALSFWQMWFHLKISIYLLYYILFPGIYSAAALISPYYSLITCISFTFHLALPFLYLSHLLITLSALIFSFHSLSPSQFPYHHPSHIMLAWLVVWHGACWIVIRVCPLSCRFEYWAQSYAGEEEGSSAASSGSWMERIRDLTDKTNGNKWLPCWLMDKHTGLGKNHNR